MSLAKTVVGRPVTFFIVFVLFVGLGVFALFQLPVDMFPEINPPVILINTVYAGAGPEEVERSVTRPLEQALSGVSSLDTITSTSSKGSSQIILNFIFGTDLSDATNSVRDALERVRRTLPDNSDSPTIFKYDPSMMPIIRFMVSSNIRSKTQLYDIAYNTIASRMEQSPGVAAASVSGGQEKIIRVDFPESRLEAYNLTVSQVQQMIAAQNAQVGAGTITEDNVAYILTTMGQYTDIEEIKNTVIAYLPKPGAPQELLPVLLGDLADVSEGAQDSTSLVYVNGQVAIQITVQKQSGKNSVRVADDLRKRLPRIQAALPPDIHITEISNNTDQIKNSISAVTKSAVSGVLLAMVVLFLFLRSMKPTLIIGISIPISIIITLMVMYFSKLTLNLMTLAGLFLGAGMLIDNSIVILENIYRYREKGTKLRPAALLGTQEMLTAITASTLTTLCVFAPLVMFKSMLEVQGELFAGLAFTIVISLTISLFTAVFLVPIMASHFMPLVTRKQRPLTGSLAAIDAVFARALEGMDNAYRKVVDRILRHKTITCAVILLIFVGSLALAVLKVGYVFMPEQSSDTVTVSATFPLGTPLDTTKQMLQSIEATARAELIVNGEPAFTRITVNAGGGSFMRASSSNSGSVQINLPPFKERTLHDTDVQAIMRRHFNEYPGATFRFQGNFTGMGGMGGNAVDIVIKTDDLKHGKEIADKIAELIRARMPEVTEPQVSMQDGLPQYEIVLDRRRMYALGISAIAAGNEIKAAVDGLTASRYTENGKDYNIVLRYKEADRSSRPALDRIFVKNSVGQRIPVSNFAKIVQGTGPVTINREGQSRTIHVTGGSVPGISLNIIEQKVKALVDSEIPAEEGLVINFEGDNSSFADIGRAFILILIVAVFLVFGIMASLFESFKDPFIILFSIPLCLIGVVMIYFITNEQFNILSAVGILILVGVILNNGIVLVDYANMLRKRGMSLHDAVVAAAGNRLRPILMSTLTTIIALAPLAFVPGEGTELVAPIGKTVFGGLTFGTLMTLFLIPAIYAIFNKHDDERRAKSEARREGLAMGLAGKNLRQQTRAAALHAHDEVLALEAEHFRKAGIPIKQTGAPRANPPTPPPADPQPEPDAHTGSAAGQQRRASDTTDDRPNPYLRTPPQTNPENAEDKEEDVMAHDEPASNEDAPKPRRRKRRRYEDDDNDTNDTNDTNDDNRGGT